MPVQQDVDEDDEDSVSLADDGLSSSSSDDEDNDSGMEDDELGQLRDSPEIAPSSTGAGAGVAKRRSTDKSSTSDSSSSAIQTPARKLSTEYFDRQQRESSPSDLSVPATPSAGTTTPGGSRRPFFMRGKSKASSLDIVEKAEKMEKEKERKKAKKSRGKKKKKRGFNLDAEHGKDILGIVVMEIKSADDLPRIKNSESNVGYVERSTSWS